MPKVKSSQGEDRKRSALMKIEERKINIRPIITIKIKGSIHDQSIDELCNFIWDKLEVFRKGKIIKDYEMEVNWTGEE
jgi:hypothetical protein